MLRVSRRQVEEICKLFNFRLVKHQMLGDRKNYWYLYSIIDSNGNCLVDKTPLREAYNALCEKCREIIFPN